MPTRTKKVKASKATTRNAAKAATKAKVAPKDIETDEVAGEIAPEKIKKSFDFEAPEAILPEKVLDDADIDEEATESEDGESDGPSLDDEELNPFKDKWEE